MVRPLAAASQSTAVNRKESASEFLTYLVMDLDAPNKVTRKLHDHFFVASGDQKRDRNYHEYSPNSVPAPIRFVRPSFDVADDFNTIRTPPRFSQLLLGNAYLLRRAHWSVVVVQRITVQFASFGDERRIVDAVNRIALNTEPYAAGV